MNVRIIEKMKKTLKNTFNYKCQNDYCENYIKPVNKKVWFKDDPILNTLMNQSDKIYDLYVEIIDLRQQIIKLRLENMFFKIIVIKRIRYF